MRLPLVLAVFFLVGLGSVSAQSNSFVVDVGGGLSLLTRANDQQSRLGQLTQVTQSAGINGFLDISEYFTMNLGLRVPYGNDVIAGSSEISAGSYTNTVTQWELGAEVKYPFHLGSVFAIAPKVGLDYIGYLGGGIGGQDLGSWPGYSSDWKQMFSPLYLTMGLDLDWLLGKRLVLRVPFSFGAGLNSRVSDVFYGGNQNYQSSVDINFQFGAEVGYRL